MRRRFLTHRSISLSSITMKMKSARNNLFAVLATSIVLAGAAAQSARAADEYSNGPDAQRQQNLVAQVPDGSDRSPTRGTDNVTASGSQSAKSGRFDTNDPSDQWFLRELERSDG
jgi:hypothetical protein